MLERGKYAWHPYLKEWVLVLGNRNVKQKFNPNGLFFTFQKSDGSLGEVRRYVLQAVSSFAAVQNPAKAENIVPIERFNPKKHITFLPLYSDNLVNWDLKVGDHVELDLGHRAARYRGVVYANDVGDSNIKVYYYSIANYEQFKNLRKLNQFRISRHSTHGVHRSKVTKIDIPAPKLTISDKARNTYVALRNNNNPAPRRWRYTKTTLQSLGEFNKKQGAVISEFMHHVKQGNMDALYEKRYAYKSAVSRHASILNKAGYINGQVYDYICTCENCGEVAVTEDMKYSEWENTSFCGSCEGNFVYSDLMGDYISLSSVLPVYSSVEEYDRRDSESFATESWLDGSEDYARFNRYWVHIDIIDELEDRRNSEELLQGYHQTTRNWVEKWEDKSFVPLGVELEVYAPNRSTAVTSVYKACKNEIYLERDGSLNEYHGFEVISQPFGKTEWQDVGVRMLDSLKSNNVVAWSEPAGNKYGIHININRKYLTPLQEARMFMFFAAEQNYGFVSAIAQRNTIYNADLEIGGLYNKNQTMYRLGGLITGQRYMSKNNPSKDCKKLRGVGKYAPICLHKERMEIRVFQSTVNQVSFFKNLEFIWALVEWTSLKSSSGTSWQHTDFLAWLSKRVRAEKDYPNLIAYLRKKNFYAIHTDDDDREVVKYANKWAEYFPKEGKNSLNGDTSEDEKAITKQTLTEAIRAGKIAGASPAHLFVLPQLVQADLDLLGQLAA